ncbi:MAG: 2,3-butanediol dehydrogenase [Proteobacteria bacterium]|nr:2,3-butanediol dehydrogenase [Pseudomonadota bacterium]MBU4371163.1 2,3-butanediol dehydrogenase [Pseudomonadota bacterium]MBU4583501.1 2,3-butanediol dehydrogenase [Pseudomonadota bacterium]MCG2739990.1 2,3-butanediol dehydrogenase [Syntrophaceae bacterium]
MNTMKALRWHDKEDIRVDEIPIPKPGPDEVLIKVMFSGICGSEVHEYLAGPIFIPLEPHPLTGTQAPQIMGHEFGGRIVELGSNVKEIARDTIVTVNPVLSCGKCKSCLRGHLNLCEQLAYYGLIGNGGHAEYAVVKAANCVPIPNDVPTEYVAFGEPAGVAYHAVNQAQVKDGSSLVVIGGGPIGQLVVQYARQAGAEKIFLTEIATSRINLAKKIGDVDEVFNPIDCNVMDEILARTEDQGVDCAIECCGGGKTGMLEDTAAQAVELTRAEGAAVIVGTFAEPTEFHFNNIVLMERKVVGSWVWQTQREYSKAMQMIVEGNVKVLPLITRKVRIEDALSDGIQTLHLHKDEHLKILVDLT